MPEAVNEAAKNDDRNALLLLLPGSNITPEGMETLSKISGLDSFIIQTRLKSKLPHLLCPVNSRNAAGTAGDRLASAGIRFLAVKKPFLTLPFQPVVIRQCRFGQERSRFYNLSNEPVELHNRENILLIEGEYHTTDGKLTIIPDTGAEAESVLETNRRRIRPVGSRDLKTFRFMMLYLGMDERPLIFIDQWMDYTFLGPDKKLTLGENFNCLRHQLEETFSCAADQRLLQYRYVLSQDRHLAEIKTKKFRSARIKEVATTAISNEAAVNRMSRLMFCQWCREKGWVDRLMPAV